MRGISYKVQDKAKKHVWHQTKGDSEQAHYRDLEFYKIFRCFLFVSHDLGF